MKKKLVILSGCLALLITAFWVVWSMISSYETTPHQGTGMLVAVDIPKRAGPRQIARLLEEQGVISNAAAFYRYVRYVRRKAGRLKAGELAFRNNMTPQEVLKVLVDGTPVNHKITIAEGLRIDEVAGVFERAGLADAREFENKAREASFARSLVIGADSLEGFLFPDTYHFRKNTPVENLILDMVTSYQRMFTPLWKERAKELGMTELEVVTLASIVEKETGAAQERALIAGVFHNRLREGWRLDTDPTVIYAVLLSKGHFDGNLTRNDLRMDHAYNTYRRTGLPPGPICNPGADAIRAALFPQKTDYMFFVSKNDGTHHFCPDLACHYRAVKRFQGGS